MLLSPKPTLARWWPGWFSRLTLSQEITVLRSLQLQSTGSTDPFLIRQNDSFAFQPSKPLLEAGVYHRGEDGAPKCTFLESLFLSPLSADEKKAVAASSHSMLEVDYSPPQVPNGVTIQGDHKLWDSQLRDIQYQAGQTIKWLNYNMHIQTQDPSNGSDPSQLSFLVAFRRNYIDFISSISPTRLNNFFKFAHIACKVPRSTLLPLLSLLIRPLCVIHWPLLRPQKRIGAHLSLRPNRTLLERTRSLIVGANQPPPNHQLSRTRQVHNPTISS